MSDLQSEGPDPDSAVPQDRLVRMGVLFYGGMIAAALLWRMGLHGESILYADAAAESRGLALLRDVPIGLIAGLLVVALSDVLTRFTSWGEALARSLAASLGQISLPNSLLLALASGLGEELFFRGALQPRVGLFWASLIFGCVHFIPRRELLPWTLFALVIGFGLGGLFLLTGNVVAPIVAHVVVNGINLPRLVRRYGAGAPGAGGS